MSIQCSPPNAVYVPNCASYFNAFSLSLSRSTSRCHCLHFKLMFFMMWEWLKKIFIAAFYSLSSLRQWHRYHRTVTYSQFRSLCLQFAILCHFYRRCMFRTICLNFNGNPKLSTSNQVSAFHSQFVCEFLKYFSGRIRTYKPPRLFHCIRLFIAFSFSKYNQNNQHTCNASIFAVQILCASPRSRKKFWSTSQMHKTVYSFVTNAKTIIMQWIGKSSKSHNWSSVRQRSLII